MTPYFQAKGIITVLSLAVLASTAAGQQVDEKMLQEIEAFKAYVQAKQVPFPMSHQVAGLPVEKPRGTGAGSLLKTQGARDRKSFFMNGNKISTELYNYGGIAPGYGLLRGVNNFVWRNMDYIFQFCPIVGASVPDARDSTIRLHIISDALYDYPSLREVNPTGDTLWAWQPLVGYADPNQDKMASNPAADTDGDGKPDSWPRSWYNPTLGKYVWPGYLSQDVTSADLEVFWAMDDRDNAEFPYYPFLGDSSRRGIGIQVDGRAFQWSNALAENTIFFVYTVTNVSDKNLDSVFFGIYGDPDLGGASPENTDDNGFFVHPYDTAAWPAGKVPPVYSRSMVYFWDPDMRGARGLPLGYLGCKYLESPGQPANRLDDDGDGIVDERQDDGIDNDGDWNAIQDDIGLDGVPNTDDEGEGDGFPTPGRKRPDGSLDPLYPGEPNFELTDLDESDQIGLTSFNSWTWNADKISNDESMWNRCKPQNFSPLPNSSDIVFIFSSAYITLDRGETKRISMALLLGETLDDLLTSAKTVQTIYNQNYRFFKPPITPKVTAVSGDRRVSLYWDALSEESIDPITGQDFEGYVIYRSTDPGFNQIQTITDGRGARFLNEPLKTVLGSEARWDIAKRDDPFTDLNGNGKWNPGEPYVDANRDGVYTAGYEDPWKGFHPVPYQDRGVQYYLGDNTGLVHSFVDSNNVINGQTYYYAVVAYDHGDSVGIPPTESTKKITLDPITGQFTFDVNTVAVVPGPRASGYIAPVLTPSHVTHDAGMGSGRVEFTILNDLEVKDGRAYRLSFGDSLVQSRGPKLPQRNYSVLDLEEHAEMVPLYDTNFSAISRSNIEEGSSFRVTDAAGSVYTEGADYVVSYLRGSIRRTGLSRIPDRASVRVTYRYFPVFQSTAMAGSDDNPAFDGVRLRVTDAGPLAYDADGSRWVQGNSNLEFTARISSIGSRKALHPADFEITFSSQAIDSAVTLSGVVVKVPVRYSVKAVTRGQPERVWTFLAENSATRNRQWDPGEEIAIFKPGSTGLTTDTLTWGVIITMPADTSVIPVLPTDGDVLFVGTKRAFDSRDVFTLRTESGRVDNSLASSRLDLIYVVPNPYIGFSEIEPINRLPGQSRGERRVYFENLPRRCTIRIFTLNGDLVQTLEHDSGVESGREYWNLLNRDGFSVAYGVYVAHVDAPGIGEKILKFALIK